MNTQSPTTKSSERIAWLSTQIAKYLTELCTLTAKTYAAKPGAKVPFSSASVTPQRGRPAKTAAQKSNGKSQTKTAIVMSWITKAGITRDAIDSMAKACSPRIRPNHVGIAINRLLRNGQISERDGKFYHGYPAPTKTSSPARKRRSSSNAPHLTA